LNELERKKPDDIIHSPTTESTANLEIINDLFGGIQNLIQ